VIRLEYAVLRLEYSMLRLQDALVLGLKYAVDKFEYAGLRLKYAVLRLACAHMYMYDKQFFRPHALKILELIARAF